MQWLPPLDRLPYLKKLRVRDLFDLERIEVENGGSSSFFPSLTDLILTESPKLTGFVIVNSTEELPCFPCLSELTFRGCPNLTYLPLFPELKNLHLDLNGIKSLVKVLKRRETSVSESISSPFFTLSRLQRLAIWEMKDALEDDELLQYLPSLQHLWFCDCECKSVANDDKDNGMQWQNLKFLLSVEFYDMQNLVCLPKGLQYVTTLQRLIIRGCPRIVCMPEWMGYLIALQQLDITWCPQLSERCKSNAAEDWPYISHIPNIYIDYVPIQMNGC